MKENEVLLRIGAYQKGSDKELDEAIAKKEFMQNFLGQNPEESFEFEETIGLLSQIDANVAPSAVQQNINMGSSNATLPNPNLK